VHVGQLLELQRALQGHRIADVPADEQHRRRGGQIPAQPLDRLHCGQYVGHLGRHRLQLGHHRRHLVGVLDAADLGQVQPTR